MFIDRVMNAWIKSAGMLGVLAAVAGIVVLPAQPVNAGHHRGGGQGGGGAQGLQTAAGLSTPSCGLKTDPYPSCPPSSDENRVTQGYAINQMKLNLTGLDVKKVGVGAYWVNSAGACTGCHAGQTATGGNPGHLPPSQGGDFAGTGYTGTNPVPYNPSVTNDPTVFMSGGNNFGPGTGCDAAGMGACGAATLLVRNVTPDFSTGKPVPAGLKPDDFIQALRTGHDFQNLHPATQTTPNPDSAVVAPADGSKLQIMPWPGLGSATDYDLESIYEYLKAIPCLQGHNAQSGAIAPVSHTCPAAGDKKYGTATYLNYTYLGNGKVEVRP